jgi:hypothetical protein
MPAVRWRLQTLEVGYIFRNMRDRMAKQHAHNECTNLYHKCSFASRQCQKHPEVWVTAACNIRVLKYDLSTAINNGNNSIGSQERRGKGTRRTLASRAA